jgi:hypothetical protein
LELRNTEGDSFSRFTSKPEITNGDPSKADFSNTLYPTAVAYRQICSQIFSLFMKAIVAIFGQLLVIVILTLAAGLTASAQQSPAATPVDAAARAAEARAKSDLENDKKAAEWVGSLNLNNAEKEARLKQVVATHLKTIRDWHNEHPYTTVPEGINPTTGRPLNPLDRQIIANSAMPKIVHTNLMNGLRKDLTEPQVEAILDKYTIGKVAFTMNGYRAIVPDLTPKEEETIMGFLKQAREEAVDYKNMNQISAIFEIYKTKSEQYLNSNGRDWRKMYKAYTDAIKVKKAADAAAKQPASAQ